MILVAQGLASELACKLAYLIRVGDFAHCCDQRLVRNNVSYSESGKTEGLGQSAHHDHIFIFFEEFGG